MSSGGESLALVDGPATAGARLCYRDESGGEGWIDLTPAGALVGRDVECTIRVADPRVSRRNCKIWLSGDRWCIEDLASTNGTFVNEQRITRQVLRHDDVIRCGGLVARFVEAIAAPAEPSLAPEPEVRADNLRQRIDDLERREAQHDEEVRVLTRVGNELRDELSGRDERMRELQATTETHKEALDSAERQLERAREEKDASRRECEEIRAQLAARAARAEEGWNQLKAQTAEMENLRRIMAEQERLLAERNVGLSALEHALQELRGERERLLRENVAARHRVQRLEDELATLHEREARPITSN